LRWPFTLPAEMLPRMPLVLYNLTGNKTPAFIL
jgi:hypothetical protein